MNKAPSIQEKILYILIGLLPIIILLIATELHLRAQTAEWYDKKLSKNHALKNSLAIHRKSDDPLLVYELTPHAETTRQGILYKINAAGFRDDEFPIQATPKQPKEYRIVVLGDSVAWGWGVDMNQAWPQRLEEELKTSLNNPQISVYNLAVNGYATPQEVRIFSKYGLGYQPDLVILNYVLNDPEVEDGGLSWYFESINRIEILYKGKLMFSFLGNVLKAKLGLLAPPPNNSTMDHFYLTHHSDLFKNVEKGFNDLAELSQKNNIPVMVIVTPVFQFNKNEPYPWAGIHQQIETLSKSHGFIFLDTQPAFTSLNGSDVSLDPIHPNSAGHQIIAEAVKNKLLSEAIITSNIISK